MAIFRDQKHYPYPTIHWIFAFSAIALVAVSVWMVWDEYTAQWKDIQREAHDILFQKKNQKENLFAKQEQLQKNVDKRSRKISQLKNKLSNKIANRTFGAVEKKLNSYKELINYKEKLKGEVEVIQTKFDKAESMITEKTSYMQVELKNNGKTDHYKQLQKKKQHWMSLRDKRKKILDKREEKYQNFVREIKEKLPSWNNIQKLLDKQETDRKQLTQIDKTIKQYNRKNTVYRIRNAPLMDFSNPSLKIEQKVLEHFKDDYEFEQVRKVDRCQTCHFFIDKPGFEDQPQPYRTHPKLKLFLGANSPHPSNEYGCTVCHSGRGRSLHFTRAAHSTTSDKKKKEWKKKYDWKPQKHWERPMKPQKYIEASCYKCHKKKESTPFASKLNRGKQLVNQMGCAGCHNIDGMNDQPNVGPSLEHMTTKLQDKDWTYRWIRKPSAFRYSKMPQFFGLINDQENKKFPKYNQIAIRGITEYLWQKSSRPENWEELPENLSGNPDRGKKLFNDRGCKACHAVGKSAEWHQSEENTNRRYGSDLGGLARKTDQQWIYNWIRHPKRYDPNARMPNLDLSKQEALDITSYLTSAEPFQEIRDPDSFKRDIPDPDSKQMNELIKKFLTVSYSDEQTQKYLNILNQDQLTEQQEEQLEENRDFKFVSDISGAKDRKLTWIGNRIIQLRGCTGCHNIPGFDNPSKVGASLTGSNATGDKPLFMFSFGNLNGNKLGKDDHLRKEIKKHPRMSVLDHNRWSWIEQKLKAPTAFNFGSTGLKYRSKLKMPRFELSDDQREALTTFLMGQNKEEIPHEYKDIPEGHENTIEDGKEIMRTKNCTACHRVGLEKELMPITAKETPEVTGKPRLDQSLTSSAKEKIINVNDTNPWLAAHLLWNPKTNQAGYQLHLSERDKNTLKKRGVEIIARKGTYLNNPDLLIELWKKGFNKLPVTAADEGTFADVQDDGGENDPPDLKKVGERIQSDWLFSFLKEPQNHRWRNGLNVRMPNFGLTDQEVLTLSKYFYARDEEPYPFETKKPLVSSLTKDQQKASQKVLKTCYKNCHNMASPQKPAPDLIGTKDRLKRGWLKKWLKDPQALEPGTAMSTALTRQFIEENLDGYDEKVLIEHLMQLTEEQYQEIQDTE